MPTKERQLSARERLLAAADELFYAEGIHTVGIDRIIEHAGVAKASLESTSRYLARHLGADGIRVNLVSAGPLKTLAMQAIPGLEDLDAMWTERAPLGWDNRDQEPTAKAVAALLSDLFPATTGEIVHVDGGYHAMGA